MFADIPDCTCYGYLLAISDLLADTFLLFYYLQIMWFGFCLLEGWGAGGEGAVCFLIYI